MAYQRNDFRFCQCCPTAWTDCPVCRDLDDEIDECHCAAGTDLADVCDLRFTYPATISDQSVCGRLFPSLYNGAVVYQELYTVAATKCLLWNHTGLLNPDNYGEPGNCCEFSVEGEGSGSGSGSGSGGTAGYCSGVGATWWSGLCHIGVNTQQWIAKPPPEAKWAAFVCFSSICSFTSIWPTGNWMLRGNCDPELTLTCDKIYSYAQYDYFYTLFNEDRVDCDSLRGDSTPPDTHWTPMVHSYTKTLFWYLGDIVPGGGAAPVVGCNSQIPMFPLKEAAVAFSFHDP